jgi:hypothetical protein
MTTAEFREILSQVTTRIEGRSLDSDLEADLNSEFPADGAVTAAIFTACRDAIAEGWMCNREAGGIRYGRVIKADSGLGRFSVDVVDMNEVVGPYHRHPQGEIDLIMPLTPGATFDGRSAGWLVYGPDSSHAPTVAGGNALVLYLLPYGAIEFSRN